MLFSEASWPSSFIIYHLWAIGRPWHTTLWVLLRWNDLELCVLCGWCFGGKSLASEGILWFMCPGSLLPCFLLDLVVQPFLEFVPPIYSPFCCLSFYHLPSKESWLIKGEVLYRSAVPKCGIQGGLGYPFQIFRSIVFFSKHWGLDFASNFTDFSSRKTFVKRGKTVNFSSTQTYSSNLNISLLFPQ